MALKIVIVAVYGRRQGAGAVAALGASTGVLLLTLLRQAHVLAIV